MLKRFFSHSLVAGIVVLSNFISSPLFSEDNLEYKVKATYIANFTMYIELPDGKPIAKQSKADVCVLGDSPIMNYPKVFEEAPFDKLNISLVREDNLANVASHCSVVFIGSTEEAKDVFSTLKNKLILTVSDAPDFVERGGMIGLVIDNGRVKFVVNKKAIEKSGLSVDSDLLGQALKVLD